MAKSWKELLTEFRKSAALSPDDAAELDDIIKEVGDKNMKAAASVRSSAKELAAMLGEATTATVEHAKTYLSETDKL